MRPTLVSQIVYFSRMSFCKSPLQSTQVCSELGPAVLHVLPKLPLGRVLSYHKQEAGCIYVNNPAA